MRRRERLPIASIQISPGKFMLDGKEVSLGDTRMTFERAAEFGIIKLTVSRKRWWHRAH